MSASEESVRVEFRLRKELAALLDERKRASGAKSANLAARAILEDELQEVRWLDIQRDVADLKHNAMRLRDNIATVLEVLMLNVAKLSRDEVEEFITRNLRDS